MSVGAWIMLAFGCLLLYGGLAVCLFIAAGARKYTDDDFEIEDENNAVE
jgi:hypothetical protein